MAKVSLFEAYSGNALQALHGEVGCIADGLRWVLERADEGSPNPGVSLAFDLMLRLEDVLEEVGKWPWPRWKCDGLEASQCAVFDGPVDPPAVGGECQQLREAG